MGGTDTEAHAFIQTDQNLTAWLTLQAKCLKIGSQMDLCGQIHKEHQVSIL